MFDRPSGFYFWNETWSDCIGPFHSVNEAKTNLMNYVDMLDYYKIKAVCTWPSDDVCIDIQDHTVILFENPRHNKPPKGDYRYGFVRGAQIALTIGEARKLGHELLQAAGHAELLDEGYRKSLSC
jgi:hypothetical protein